MEKRKKERVGPWALAWLQRDGLYIAIIMLALVACLFVWAKLDQVMDDCNQAWKEQLPKICTDYIMQDQDPELALDIQQLWGETNASTD